MSVLFSPRFAAPARPAAVHEPAVPMVDWALAKSGAWTARIGLDRAGEVRLTPLGYHLLDWDGTDLGTWPTLAEAKRRLEPEVRAALREASERPARPVASLVGTAAVSTTAATLLVTAAWFALQSL